MVGTDDAQLVKRAQRGDVDAIGHLYDEHHQPIFRYVWSRARDQQLAEDLTGEIFTRMVANLSSYKPTNAPFRAWLYRIARNLLVDYHRSQNGRFPASLEQAKNLSDDGSEPGPIVERQLTLEQIQAALTRIDPAQQEVVVLRFVAGLSLADVAHALDKTVPAIKSLQHRGLTALRAALKEA
ncbi:MAG: sigma-70 family RNA polymerase sigma factor [Chloroflexi bacterium]|nr:sigma-70 family RNA polymerase sigma factor [Chloroflexota bacterium]